MPQLPSPSEMLRGFRNMFPGASEAESASELNGVDDDYPWRFDGRFWFRPALVRAPQEPLPGGLAVVSLFGWTLGGVVALEYDESPVGPYREYVTLGAVVSKRGAVGQWGRRLFVSTKAAEEVCQRVWGVPAEVRGIDFAEPGPALRVEAPPELSAADEPTPAAAIRVSGWAATRDSSAAARRGALPILWTPAIKTLWAPLVPFPPAGEAEPLPLHDLRLSAGGLRLQICGQPGTETLGLPLPVGFSVENVRIEISRAKDEVL